MITLDDLQSVAAQRALVRFNDEPRECRAVDARPCGGCDLPGQCAGVFVLDVGGALVERHVGVDGRYEAVA